MFKNHEKTDNYFKWKSSELLKVPLFWLGYYQVGTWGMFQGFTTKSNQEFSS